MKAKHDEDTETATPAADIPDLDVNAHLRRCGIYYVWGPITEGSLKETHQDLLLKHFLGPKRYNSPVQFILNSSGGDADEAMSLIDLLGNLRFPVGTAGFGTCGSAAAMLLACGTKGLRTVAPNCGVMIHVYAWSSAGNHHDLLAHRKAEDDEYNKEIDFWSRHSKYKGRADIEKHLLKKQDTWLSAKEAVAHGIADHIGSVLR